MVPGGLPTNWRDFLTEDERAISNRWAMYGWDCIGKVGRKWDSTVPAAPLFPTKKAAHEFLTRFVCDAIPLRCALRAEAATLDAPRCALRWSARPCLAAALPGSSYCAAHRG